MILFINIVFDDKEQDYIGIVVPVEAKDRDDVCDKISRETGAVLIHPFNGLFFALCILL